MSKALNECIDNIAAMANQHDSFGNNTLNRCFVKLTCLKVSDVKAVCTPEVFKEWMEQSKENLSTLIIGNKSNDTDNVSKFCVTKDTNNVVSNDVSEVDID